MANILLCSADFVRSVTSISDNVQDKYLQPSIVEAQTFEFQQVVGSRMFNVLKGMVSDGSISQESNAAYKQLLDYAQYFIAYAAVAKLVMTTGIKIGNIGIYKASDENVESLDLSDIKQVEQYYVNKADYFKKEVQRYILNNKSELPEIGSDTCSCIKSNLYSAASTGVWLGGERGRMTSRCEPSCGVTSGGGGGGGNCDECFTEGYSSGYTAGEEEGFSEGYSSGVTIGELNGYENGHSVGYDEGMQEGFRNGYSVGIHEGYLNGFENGYLSGITEHDTFDSGFNSGYTYGMSEGYLSGYTNGEETAWPVGYASGHTDGYNEGFESGSSQSRDVYYQSGYTVGYDSGYTKGFGEGFDSGYTQGYDSGVNDGYSSGFTVGYDSGYTNGLSSVPLQTVSTSITTNGLYVVTPDSSHSGISQCSIEVYVPSTPSTNSGCTSIYYVNSANTLDFCPPPIGTNLVNRIYSSGETNVLEAVIPYPMKNITFKGTRYLANYSSLTIGEGAEYISFSADLDIYTFNTSITSFTTPSTTIGLLYRSFFNCKFLTEVHLNEGLRFIGIETFMWNDSLREINLPISLEEIGSRCFYGCHSLTSITIPGSVKIIMTNTFDNCSNLESIYFGDGVSVFSERSIFSGQKLKTVSIGPGVSLIQKDGLLAYNLTDITFRGTMSTWNSIEKDPEWNSYNIIKRINCSDGVITL